LNMPEVIVVIWLKRREIDMEVADGKTNEFELIVDI